MMRVQADLHDVDDSDTESGSNDDLDCENFQSFDIAYQMNWT